MPYSKISSLTANKVCYILYLHFKGSYFHVDAIYLRLSKACVTFTVPRTRIITNLHTSKLRNVPAQQSTQDCREDHNNDTKCVGWFEPFESVRTTYSSLLTRRRKIFILRIKFISTLFRSQSLITSSFLKLITRIGFKHDLG